MSFIQSEKLAEERQKHGFGTLAVHAGVEPDPSTGAIMTPIFQTSTYVQEAPGQHKGFEYARTHNPTRRALEKALAELEHGTFGSCFASGMAAIDTIMKTLKAGDHVIATNDLYGGSYRIFERVFAPFGIQFSFVDMTRPFEVEDAILSNTAMLWVETPTNPLMRVIDIERMAEIAHDNEALLAVDNTFASPYLQNPLDLGADLVVHSITKYLGGHSDTVMGCIVTNDPQLHDRIKFLQNSCGAVPGPQDCFLVLRGLKTLHLRMKAHCENGAKVARFLDTHDRVGEVYWPGLESHSHHELAKKQMKDFGGMISFTLVGDDFDDAMEVLSRTKLFALAESLGGVESLIGHPASMTHASIPKEEREKSGLKDTLIRLSVGIEDVEDLIADLKQAIG